MLLKVVVVILVVKSNTFRPQLNEEKIFLINFEDFKVIFKQNLNFFMIYCGIFKYTILDVVFHQDSKNGIENWKILHVLLKQKLPFFSLIR